MTSNHNNLDEVLYMKNVERWAFLIIKQITDYLTVSGADKVMQSVCELMVEAVNTEVDNNEILEGERDLVPKKNKGWLLPEFTRKFILDNRKAVRLRGFCPEPKIKDRHGRGRGDHLQTCRADQAPRWAGGDQASLWQDSGQAGPGVYHIIWRTKISSLSFSSTPRSSTSHLSQVWLGLTSDSSQSWDISPLGPEERSCANAGNDFSSRTTYLTANRHTQEGGRIAMFAKAPQDQCIISRHHAYIIKSHC